MLQLNSNTALFSIKGAFLVFAFVCILRLQMKILKIILIVAVLLVATWLLAQEGLIPVGV